MNIQLICLYECQGHFIFVFQNEGHTLATRLETGPRQMPALRCRRRSYAAYVLLSLGSLRDAESRVGACCLEFIRYPFLPSGEGGTVEAAGVLTPYNLITQLSAFFCHMCTHVKFRLLRAFLVSLASSPSTMSEPHVACLLM